MRGQQSEQSTPRRSMPPFARISIYNEIANEVLGASSHPPGTGHREVIDVPIEPHSLYFDRAIGIAQIFFRKQNTFAVTPLHTQQHCVEILVPGLDLLRRNRGAGLGRRMPERGRREPGHLTSAPRLDPGRDDQELPAADTEIANSVLNAATPDLDPWSVRRGSVEFALHRGAIGQTRLAKDEWRDCPCYPFKLQLGMELQFG